MNCLYCGTKIGLRRKLAGGLFCSSTHQESFEREFQIRLLDRLGVLVGKSGDLVDNGPVAGRQEIPFEKVPADKTTFEPTPAGLVSRNPWRLATVQSSAAFEAELRFSGIHASQLASLAPARPVFQRLSGWFNLMQAVQSAGRASAFQAELQVCPFRLSPWLNWLGQVGCVAVPSSFLADLKPGSPVPSLVSATVVDPSALAGFLPALPRPSEGPVRSPSHGAAALLAPVFPAPRPPHVSPLHPPSAPLRLAPPVLLRPRAQAGGAAGATEAAVHSSSRLPGGPPSVTGFRPAVSLTPGLPAARFVELIPKVAIRFPHANGAGFLLLVCTPELPRMAVARGVAKLPWADHAALHPISQQLGSKPITEGAVTFRALEPHFDCALGLCTPPLASLAPPARARVRPRAAKAHLQPRPVYTLLPVPPSRPRKFGRAALVASLVVALVYLYTRPDAASLVQSRWRAARRAIQDRSVIALEQNFSNGMVSWRQGSNKTRSWSYDRAGFVRPASLALFPPSLYLTDYRLDFSAMIERKGIGWVFRATDLQNYYAIKIVLLSPRPPYPAAMLRYAVIEGEQDAVVQSPARLYLAPDTPFRVRLDAKGQQFTASIHDREVDSWNDTRLKSGGVGFFSDKGDRNRLFWVRVSHQEDFLGRLCAYIAPQLPQTLNWRTIP